MDSIKQIQRHLLQDIYEWAGQDRRVNISEKGKPFLTFHSFIQVEKCSNIPILTVLA